MSKMAQRQGLVTIEGISGGTAWATKTGGDVSADVTPVWDGGSQHPEQLASPPSADNVTVSRPVDDQRELAEMKRIKKLVGELRATLTVQPTNGRLFAIGEPEVYPEALLVRATSFNVDAASGDSQVWELEWAISDFV